MHLKLALDTSGVGLPVIPKSNPFWPVSRRRGAAQPVNSMM
jgi:hypothetical protein